MDNAVESRLKLIQILVWAAIVVLLCIMYRVEHPVNQIFYEQHRKSGEQTQMIRLRGVVRPVINNTILTQWSSIAAMSLFNYTAGNYTNAIPIALKTFFTQAGATAYYEDFIASKSLEDVIEKSLTVTAVAQGPTVILRQGILKGIYSWKVQLPILVTYSSLSEDKLCDYVVSMVINKIPTWQSPKGIGVNEFWLSTGQCHRQARAQQDKSLFSNNFK